MTNSNLALLTEFKCGAVNQNTWEYTRTARACLVWQKLREFLVKTSNQDGPLNFPMKNLSRSYLTASFQTTSTSKTRFIVNTNHAPNLISERFRPILKKKKKKKKKEDKILPSGLSFPDRITNNFLPCGQENVDFTQFLVKSPSVINSSYISLSETKKPSSSYPVTLACLKFQIIILAATMPFLLVAMALEFKREIS